jgi:protein SCO1
MTTNKTLRFIFAINTIWILLASVSCSALGSSFKGAVLKPVTSAPQIDMPDQNGVPFKLSDLQGDIALIFFGFTNCVDECPLTMAYLTAARQTLGDNTGRVHVILVSTDPERDTPYAMRDYLSKFDPTYIGITGTLDELTKIWNDYDVVVEDGGEAHSSYTYVVDQNGDLRLHFDPETSPDDIAADLKTLLASR